MYHPNLAVIIAVLALLLTLTPLWCEAIKCYNCVSKFPKTCSDKDLEDCQKGEICSMLELLLDGQSYLARNCNDDSNCTELIESMKHKVRFEKYLESTDVRFDHEKSHIVNCKMCRSNKCNRVVDHLQLGPIFGGDSSLTQRSYHRVAWIIAYSLYVWIGQDN